MNADKKIVLVVDDDKDMTALLRRWLEDLSYHVENEENGDECLRRLSEIIPDAICLDLNIAGLHGLEVLKIIRERNPSVPVIMLTSDKKIDVVVMAMQLGAYDYLVKPVDKVKLLTTIGNAIEKRQLSMSVRELRRETGAHQYKGIIGESDVMKRTFSQLDKIALSDVTVFLHGESGSGKEVFAKTIHHSSGRKDGPFIAVNCAAIPEQIAESEFFGHEKGSFTGAHAVRKGRLEEADKGTLFLDEVAELSPAMQAKLLRALQEKSFCRVGSNTEIRSDFRLVSATHRDLAEEVRAGRFRSDLFFRIAVFELEIPSLRKRKSDIPALVQHFLKQSRVNDEEPYLISSEALEVLMAHDWPGNIRELQNVIQRSVVVSSNGIIQMADLPTRLLEPVVGSATFKDTARSEGTGTMEDVEKNAILEALKQSNGNISEAIRQLKIGRTTLYRKMKKYQIT